MRVFVCCRCVWRRLQAVRQGHSDAHTDRVFCHAIQLRDRPGERRAWHDGLHQVLPQTLQVLDPGRHQGLHDYDEREWCFLETWFPLFCKQTQSSSSSQVFELHTIRISQNKISILFWKNNSMWTSFSQKLATLSIGDHKNVKTHWQCMFLTEKTELPFFFWNPSFVQLSEFIPLRVWLIFRPNGSKKTKVLKADESVWLTQASSLSRTGPSYHTPTSSTYDSTLIQRSCFLCLGFFSFC